MNCPVCDAPLRTVEKYGVEVDICPGCKGVWLDRGELEKIIELESAGGPAQGQAYENRPREAAPRYHEEHRHHDHDRDHDHDDDKYRRPQYDQHGRPYKKRGSWLGDILGSFGGDD